MSDETLPAHLERIERRLAVVGLKPAAASMRAFGYTSAIKNMRSGLSRSPSIDTFEKLAPVLKTTAAWLAFGVGEAEGPGESIGLEGEANDNRYVPVTGLCAAGTWRDVDAIDDAVYAAAPIAFDDRFDREAQFAFRVEGTSINRIAEDGDYIVCVDKDSIGYQERNGDLVVVERTRDDGQSWERTVKQYFLVDGVHEFRPCSTEPHKTIVIDPDNPDETGATRVRVRGPVISAYRHLTDPPGFGRR